MGELTPLFKNAGMLLQTDPAELKLRAEGLFEQRNKRLQRRGACTQDKWLYFNTSALQERGSVYLFTFTGSSNTRSLGPAIISAMQSLWSTPTPTPTPWQDSPTPMGPGAGGLFPRSGSHTRAIGSDIACALGLRDTDRPPAACHVAAAAGRGHAYTRVHLHVLVPRRFTPPTPAVPLDAHGGVKFQPPRRVCVCVPIGHIPHVHPACIWIDPNTTAAYTPYTYLQA